MLDTIDAYVDPRNKVVDVERYFLDDEVHTPRSLDSSIIIESDYLRNNPVKLLFSYVTRDWCCVYNFYRT